MADFFKAKIKGNKGGASLSFDGGDLKLYMDRIAKSGKSRSLMSVPFPGQPVKIEGGPFDGQIAQVAIQCFITIPKEER